MSNVIDLNVSLFAIKCQTKTFLQNNELTVTMQSNKQTLFPDYKLCSMSLNVTLTTAFYDSILYFVVCIVLYCLVLYSMTISLLKMKYK